eukprot:TRINITY_DN35854_c1_g1_i1.p4 TRINITY_DN35854_c1_g1~~TRINITY_DN35854_c1_g1_i1.p4  ORF type:complete len:125 (-),score=3.12 TRINITY_DN35854_c1_g1_i1:65-439(-)
MPLVRSFRSALCLPADRCWRDMYVELRTSEACRWKFPPVLRTSHSEDVHLGWRLVWTPTQKPKYTPLSALEAGCLERQVVVQSAARPQAYMSRQDKQRPCPPPFQNRVYHQIGYGERRFSQCQQ